MRQKSRTMHKLILALVCALFGAWPAFAQNGTGVPVTGQAAARSTVNGSVSITVGNTFQQILPAATGETRQSLTIQNNNTTTDNCWIYLGSGTATKATSILLTPGLPYQRYFPYVPSDAIQGTCATTADTLYVDTQ